MAEGTPGPAVRVRGLTKRYGAIEALAGIDLDVATGELRGLLGPNGAGKTTLLRAMFGLVHADAGSIELLGRRVDRDQAGTQEGVAGFVEDPAFYPYLSGWANLELLAELDDLRGTPIDDALSQVDLSARARDKVGGYSTGMRQRLGIAAALMRSPRLLLLDEPTSGLDPAGIRAVSTLLGELSAHGVAVIISSHLIGELEAICHSYTIIRDGRVVWDGQRSKLEHDAPGSVYALSTTDDARALDLARERTDTQAEPAQRGLRLTARSDALDGYAIALGAAGVGVRRLELTVSPLESLFFTLTSDALGQPASAR